ncbi:MAG: HlyD family type I secretion periplasmic adaptor subunit [Comamonadaceae bacterium]|nr:HlyD family type I secretion periplasmic adaptor subunit [Comamonadaceae bacterium]
MAERDNADRIRFHADVTAALADPQVQSLTSAQEQLFSTRRAALRAELQSITESIEGHKGTLAAYRSMIESRQTQLALLKEELAATRGTVDEGYAPRNRQRELERMVADAHSALAELQGNVVRTTRSIGELSQRSVQRRNEYFKELGAQLTEVLRDVEADGPKFRAATEELQRMEVRSPATGEVVGLGVQTVGAVIQPAQKLMDVVPEGDALLLEAHVPPHLIDRIKPGLPVDARFSSFSHAPQLVVDARVSTVSADLITDPQTRTSYYLARVAVTPEGLKTLGNRTLQPGMPAEVVVRTGERSLLTYMLHPLVKRLATSMKEE